MKASRVSWISRPALWSAVPVLAVWIGYFVRGMRRAVTRRGSAC
jgi:hypothetical protein